MIEGHDHLMVFYLHAFIQRATAFYRLAVIVGQGPQSQSFSHIPFIAWMDIPHISDIGSHCHSGTGRQGQGFKLGFLDQRSLQRAVVLERSNLHKIEWKIIVPCLSPAVDHGREQPSVDQGIAGIGFPLVPQCPGNPIRCQRINHRIVGACRKIRPLVVFREYFPPGGKLGIGLNNVFWGPGFSRRPAPTGMNDPNGNMELFGQFTGKEISDSAEPWHGLRAADFPLGICIFLGII